MSRYCTACGTVVTEEAAFCAACGAPTARQQAPAHPSSGPNVATPDMSGRSCPYCRFPLKEGAPIATCADCRAVHHEDCWGENNGCAIGGCGAKAALNAAPPVTARKAVPTLAPTAAAWRSPPSGVAAAWPSPVPHGAASAGGSGLARFLRFPGAPLDPSMRLAGIVAQLLFGDLFIPWYSYDIFGAPYTESGWRAEMLDRTLVIAVAAGFVLYVVTRTWTILETPPWSLSALCAITLVTAAVIAYRLANPPFSDTVNVGGFIALALCAVLARTAHQMRRRERDGASAPL